MVGVDLRKERKAAGYSSRGFAKVIGVDKSTYCRYETGKRKVPARVAIRMEKVFSISWILFLDVWVKCSECGGLCLDGDYFCSWCGTSLSGGENNE